MKTTFSALQMDLSSLVYLNYAIIASLSVIFLQQTAGIADENTTLVDILNLAINAATIAVLTFAGQYARKKIKEFVEEYKQVSQVLPKLEQISQKVSKVDEIDRTVNLIQGKVETIERNTGNEITEMKKRYVEVLERLAVLEKNATNK